MAFLRYIAAAFCKRMRARLRLNRFADEASDDEGYPVERWWDKPPDNLP